MRNQITTLLVNTKTAKWADQSVTQYSQGDMEEIFNDAERTTLAAGQPVIRTDKYGATMTFTDLVAFHAANVK